MKPLEVSGSMLLANVPPENIYWRDTSGAGVGEEFVCNAAIPRAGTVTFIRSTLVGADAAAFASSSLSANEYMSNVDDDGLLMALVALT